MAERALHVIVSTTRSDSGTRAIAVATGDVFEVSATGSAPIAVPLATDPAPRSLSPAAELDGADVLIALDAVALENARGANVGLRVALWPGLGDAWLGSVEGADLVLVAHESQLELALARGASRTDVEVVGPLAPDGAAPTIDRAGRLAALFAGGPKLDADTRLVVLPFSARPGADLTTTLTQLSLVTGSPLCVFDVEDDVEAAKSIRAIAPRFGLSAAMVSERDVAAAVYGVADAILVRLEGPETFAALASGASLVVVKPKHREGAAAHALETAKLATVAQNVSMLAVAIDAALASDTRTAARTAIEALDVAGTPQRIRTAVERARARHRSRATGLPRGLELLASDPADATAAAVAPLVSAYASRKVSEAEAIERELEELKKRISG